MVYFFLKVCTYVQRQMQQKASQQEDAKLYLL